MTPLEIIAGAAHDYSDSLPKTSQDRALLFSRRFGFAEAALKALEAAGYGLVRRETINSVFSEVNTVYSRIYSHQKDETHADT